MAKVNGGVVRAYLYKSVWTLTVGSSGGDTYKLRIGGETTAAIADTASASAIQAAVRALDQFEDTDVTVTGASSPFTISFIGDYTFSGIGVEVVDVAATVTVSVARSFPTIITNPTEANGFYIMGAESSLDKSYSLESQDITNKESDGWKESESQIRSITLSAQNYFMSTADYDKLQKQFEKNQPVILCDIEPNVTGTSHIQNYGIYIMNSLNQGGVHNQVVDFTADFELTGEPTRVTATS
jgi:predicted secreted protein